MKKHILLTSLSMAVASALFAQSGNVGIGTTTPQTKLDVKNNSVGDHALGLGGAAPSIRFYGGDTLPVTIPTTYIAPYAKMGLATAPGHFTTSSIPGDLVIQTIDTNNSIIFSNDFNNGGTEQMRLNGNGNLGIGTTVPAAKLHVAGNVRIADGTQGLNKILSSDADGTSSWKTATELGIGNGWALAGNSLAGTEVLGSTNTQPLRIVTNSTERMRITETGLVGIGTATPNFALDINGGTTAPTVLRISNSSTISGPELRLSSLGAEGREYRIGSGQSSNASGLGKFFIFDAAAGFDRLVIDSTGNVGIGTIAPTNKLDVNGTARIRTVSQAPNTVTTVPLYKDANGVVVTAPAATNYGATTFGSAATIAPATTGTLLTIPAANGSMYKLLVRAINACGDQGGVEYLLILGTTNSFYSIKPTGSNVGSTVSVPTFTQANRANVTVAWNNVPVCAGGGGVTNLNHTINVVLSGANFLINITNNGDTTPAYQAILTKMFD
jgi:hypothetical protein